MSWKIVVSEWWSVTAMSALSNWQNCTCACKTLQSQLGRTHSAGCVRQWFTTEPLGEHRYENWNTHTHPHCHVRGREGLQAGLRWLEASDRSTAVEVTHLRNILHWAKAEARESCRQTMLTEFFFF